MFFSYWTQRSQAGFGLKASSVLVSFQRAKGMSGAHGKKPHQYPYQTVSVVLHENGHPGKMPFSLLMVGMAQ